MNSTLQMPLDSTSRVVGWAALAIHAITAFLPVPADIH
jgi:hypothetical protein